MSIAGTVEFRVTTEELVRQSAEVSRLVDHMRNIALNMEQIVGRTNRYWIGEAGEACRSAYEERRGELSEMLQRLRTYPDDLLKIAGIYTQVSEAAAGQASALQTNVIH